MKLGPGAISPRHARRTAGFTLAEVLASLVFMAIVIPVAIEGLHIAAGAGERAARRNEAAMVADQLLDEAVITGSWSRGVQNGTMRSGLHEFSYALRNEPWLEDINATPIRLISVEVGYQVQGRDLFVRLSTLADETQLTNLMNSALP